MPIEDRLVSIVIPTFNRAGRIAKSLHALLDQTHRNIEIIVSDDGSTDDTVSVVESIRDPRVTLVVAQANCGASGARNAAILRARGEVIFFTDDDVVVSPEWVERGLRYFASNECVGIEGRLVYVSEEYRPGRSDRRVENPSGGRYMTANAAYRRATLLECGMFDTRFRRFQDRELALRVMRHGSVVFAHDVVATHDRDIFTATSYMFEATKIDWWVLLYKTHKDASMNLGIVYEPGLLLGLVFPPLAILRSLFFRVRGIRDLEIACLFYPFICYQRARLWRAAARSRVLIL